jgi:uncharacterized protein YdbL (DUF1318 family)
MNRMTGYIAAPILGPILALALVAAPAFAQRDPAYAAARASGDIGEKMDGYLGFVGTPSASLRALVEDLNIKRRANYTERARAQNATVEEYALTQGCILIARTSPGEKYQTPGGGWATRTTAAPQRDSRCP